MSSYALRDRRPPSVTERDAVLRRFDLAARGALLSAGLFAQSAMWVVGHSRVYLVSAVLLIAASAESARRPLATFVRTPKGQRRHFSPRQVAASRMVAAVLVLEVCFGVVGWLHVTDILAVATPLGVLLVAIQAAHATAVETRRDLKLGCAVVIVLLVHAGAFTTTAAVRLPMVLALLSLLAAAALLQRCSALSQVDAIVLAGRAPLTRAWTRPVAGAAVIGLTVFLALPNSLALGVKVHVRHSGHGGSSTASADPASASAAGSAPAAGSGVAAGRGVNADPGATSFDLRVRGTLPNATVFVVSADAPAYWQGAVFDHFDGTSWTTTAGVSPVRWAVDGAGVQTAGAVVDGTEGARRTDIVEADGAQPLDAVLAPGQPVGYQGPGQVVADTDGVARLTDGPSGGVSYRVTSTKPVAGAAKLRTSSGADVADPRWLSVPADLPTRVPNLARQLAGGAASRYDAVTAIEDYLRTHETYDLASPLPAAGQDAVDDFLFTSHRGFCEQFSSAEVMLLRSVDVPARLVVGFAHGDTSSQPGKRVMRGADAHAWVQVWYGGVGWVDSDPTASSALPAGQAAATQAAAPQATAPPATAPQATSSQASPSAQPAKSTQSGGPSASAQPAPATQPAPVAAKHRPANVPGGRRAWFEGIAVIVLLTTLLTRIGGRLLRRRRRRPSEGWRPTDGPVLQAYLRLDASLAGASCGREPEETLREVGRRLGGAVATGAEVTTTLHCLERECYGIESPARAEVVAAVEVLDRLRRAVGKQPVVANRENPAPVPSNRATASVK